ncbi:MAG: 4-hydroxythreonine-4-phosphate dehydrogenase PdxA [Bdellovibrionales bacterium]|nr:4-hydroxythreonine-4-phosphate dehydrogenase PdxA [Bdellovibrionales bacterium]
MRSSKSTASKRRLLITTGDSDGIGWEVTAKALNALGPRPGVQFVFYRHAKAAKTGPALIKKFRRVVATSLQDAAGLPFDPRAVIEVRSSKAPALWVEEAAQACMSKQFDALVTAPLSKTSIIEAGLNDIGHTEILARVSGVHDLFMGFVGAKFCVVLATGHEPLAQAVRSLNLEKMAKAIQAARELRSSLPERRRRLPMALVGLNPHAGEHGLLGSEEGWFGGLTSTDVRGPLVPDGAFLPKNWKIYSVFVCPYHDQGLIPFKLVHGFSGGVHLTLGLPFVRTSVDHGTAKELYGKNKADAGSMRDALTTAIRLIKERNV